MSEVKFCCRTIKEFRYRSERQNVSHAISVESDSGVIDFRMCDFA
uniref:DUF2262 domain-containing protein n=1 Tax=Haemonchus contortus TaxID=6289 RepID=A0A7I4Y5P1_HAECO